jgi:membrane protein YqaA with SNARE-associated domain
MAEILKGAMYLGAAYVLAQGISKDKILTDKNVRNVAIGGLAGYLLGDKLEDFIEREMSPEDKKNLYSTLAGMGVGGLSGYLISNGGFDLLKDKFGGYFAKKGEDQDPGKK